ncbi:hypothetical protein ADK55_18560 [Streptomyces sp. WM4235]|uniref:hypothetical protein n=1 Tax=Streptomyces sp. WM4235 TaxID=1415551 RepID=UPI0006B04DCA|nr:hypothetical protein [Streptomyces sp. WM4235]KOU50546.1 hypothetical protein ADK55_18560 [Streptomyces sp. WM4235]
MSDPSILRQNAIDMVNLTSRRLDLITGYPDGTSRSVPGDVAAGVLTAQSNLAIATALIAVADAIRATAAEPQP